MTIDERTKQDNKEVPADKRTMNILWEKKFGFESLAGFETGKGLYVCFLSLSLSDTPKTDPCSDIVPFIPFRRRLSFLQN